jgi:predicted ATPase/class 3 adenylate cyclase/DNA-binding SARP family transcriptional activator
MARLTVSLLGPFEVKLDGKPVTSFDSNKVRALLAYLAVETGRHPGGHLRRLHRREVLAGLLWPDWPERSARTNLRNALSRLRTVIGDRQAEPPYLLITRETMQFNAASDHWIDVTAFSALVEAQDVTHHQLEEAVALYRGLFLEGFSFGDSPAYEDWMLLVRERLQRQVLEALQRLADHGEACGEYERASKYAWRRVELAPWQEQAHQSLMRLLALNGQRGAALAQYETCRRALREELDVEPGEETRRLYERIRDGELAPPGQAEDVGAISTPRKIGASPDSPEFPPSSQELPPSPQPPPSTAARQRPAPIEGERRVVTALLADVKGSTALAELIDTEDWVEIMNRVFQILGAEIYRYGGEIDQYRGDGLVAFFGLPTAHEDDPERAVLAALAMQGAVEEYAAELLEQEGIDLSLRVGVNTGEVIAASVGDHRHHREATAMGRAVALASRMETACEPGTTLVTEDTYRLVAPLFEWQALGEIVVKGVSQPIAVYRPLARAAPARDEAISDKGRGVAGLESPLVGREVEVRALEEAIEHLQAGVGGIVTVVGEAGIGKSRLVTEIRKWANRQIDTSQNGQTAHRRQQIDGSSTQPPSHQATQPPNPQWVEARCLSYATTVAYQLWLDVLRGLLSVAPDASPTVVHDALQARVEALCSDCYDDVYPYLGQMMSLPLEEEAEAMVRGLDAESLRFVTFRALETLIESAARRQPLAIVCEDLHWADPTSLELLEQSLSLTDRAPVILICVFRPEMTHKSWRIKEIAARDYVHRHTDLWLRPLSPAESETLVGNLLHVGDVRPELGKGLPGRLRERILSHAEGNPFYVEEILRALIDDGVIVQDVASGRWQAMRDVSGIPIPATLHGALAARIDRLPPEAKHILQLASVVGRSFTYPVLSAIYSSFPQPAQSLPQRSKVLFRPLDGGEFLDAQLVVLQRAQLISEQARVPERVYAFKHALAQEAAYSGLLRRERQRYHRQIAQALERLYPERVKEQLGLLAYHWEQAGETEHTVVCLRRAGEQAARQFANAEAIAYFGRALDLAPQDDLESRHAILLAREEVHNVQGARESQHQDLVALASLTKAMKDKGRQAKVAVRQAHYAIMTVDYGVALAAAQAAVRLAQAAGDVESEAAGHLHWGRAFWRQGRYDDAQLQLKQALDLARSVGLRSVEAHSLRSLGLVYEVQHDLVQASACHEQSLRICRQTGNRRGEGMSLRDLGFISYYLGDYAEAKSRFGQSLRVCSETGDRRDEAWALLGTGRLCWDLGEYAEARRSVEQSVRLLRETDDRQGEAYALGYLSRFYYQLGDYIRARDYLAQGLRVWREIFEDQDDLDLAYRGLLSHHLGDDQAAWEYCQQALHAIQEFGERSTHDLMSLGHALADLGHLNEAADVYRQAMEVLQKTSTQPHLITEPWAALGRLSLAQGDPVQAQAYVEEILSYLETYPELCGTDEPFRVYLTCYRVLRANDDPRTRQILDAAYRLLQERANNIDDEELCRSFLENVPAHREIVEAWEEASHRIEEESVSDA